MPVPSETHAEKERFYLDSYVGTQFEASLIELIEQGHLEEDVLFRLGSIGHNEVDEASDKRLLWVTIQDLIAHAKNPSELRTETRALLEGDMPNAIVDWNLGANHSVRASFEHMYYSVGNLAMVINERGFMSDYSEDERSDMSKRVAKGLWRTIVMRHHPEWLNDPETYYMPTIFHETVYTNVKPRTMRAQVVSHAVLSDPLVYGTYVEAETTGVKGIADKGKESLRLLLLEEHPELI